MKFLRIVLPLALLGLVTACGPSPAEKPPYAGIKLGQEYEVNGRWYKPHYDKDYDEIGMASWYGPGFHGGKTANGERFDQYDLTAAHRTLPLPCIVRVTNLDNGKSAIIRVNDRGPFARNRILDVSKAAAAKLDMIGKGSAKVRVQFLEEETREYVQNLQEKGQSYAIAALKNVNPDAAAHREEERQAQLQTQPPALQSDVDAEEAANERVPVSHTIHESTLAPPTPFQPPVNTADSHQSDEFSVAADAYAAPVAADPIAARAIAPAVTGQSNGFFVQAGTFGVKENANKLLSKLTDIGQAQVTEFMMGGRKLYRVIVGPYNMREDAKNMLSKLASIGIPDAKIIHN